MKPAIPIRSTLVAASSCLASMLGAGSAWSAQPGYAYELTQGGVGMQAAGSVFEVDFKAADAAPSFAVGSSVITRAQLDMSFTGSDARRLMNTGPLESSVEFTSWGTLTRTNQTKLFDDIADSVKLKIGGGAQTAFVDDYGPPPYTPYYNVDKVSTETTEVFHDVNLIVTSYCYFPNISPCPVGYVQTKTELVPYDHTEVVQIDTVNEITGGYKGSFSLQLGLNPAALAAFSLTGVLPVAWEVRTGGVAVDSATLRFDVASVPEPASSLMFGGGALLLGMFSMRRRLAPNDGDTPAI